MKPASTNSWVKPRAVALDTTSPIADRRPGNANKVCRAARMMVGASRGDLDPSVGHVAGMADKAELPGPRPGPPPKATP